MNRWCKKWNKYLETSTEYGANMKSGWQAVIESSDKTSEIHSEIAKKLTDEQDAPCKLISKYNRENYRKRTLKKYSFKKTHEFRVNFMNAQKHWADLQEKIKLQNKEYEKAVKTNKNQKRELERMNSFRHEIKNYQPIYVNNLKKVFEETQNFELDRMNTFVSVFKKYHDTMRINDNGRFESIFKDLFNVLSAIDPKQDLQKWSENYGPGTHFPKS